MAFGDNSAPALDDDANGERDQRDAGRGLQARRVHGATNQRRMASSAVAHIA